QRGQLLPASGMPADGFWRGRWREDIISTVGVKRRRVQVILGSTKELPSRKLAMRALQSRLDNINSMDYRPRPEATFEKFTAKWKEKVLSQFKKSVQSSERSRLKTRLVPFFGRLPMKEISAEAIQSFVSTSKDNP